MPTVKNAVIAVAGIGKRLGLGKPKCLVKVLDKNILEYQLSLLKDFENVFLVTGFGEDAVMDFASKIRRDIIFVKNPNFQHTKTLGSFYLAAKIINDFAIFLDGDMIIEPNSFNNFLKTSQREIKNNIMTIAVSQRISDDPVYADVKISTDGAMKIYGFSYEKKTPYEWANIVCMSAKLMKNGNSHTFEYLQQFLPSAAAVIDRLEIDTPQDLKIAEENLKINGWF